MAEYQAVEVRATGQSPETVIAEIGQTLEKRSVESWDQRLRPVSCNSSTTVFFRRGAIGG